MRNRFTCFSALLLIAVAGCSVTPRTESSDTALEVEATQAVISWLTTQKPMAGFVDAPGTNWVLAQAERLPVVCDYVDAGIALSSDPRVARVSEAELERLWKTFGYDKTVYVWLNKERGDDQHLTIEVKYAFGNVGGHSYEFKLWRSGGQLQAQGQLKGSA